MADELPAPCRSPPEPGGEEHAPAGQKLGSLVAGSIVHGFEVLKKWL